MKWDPILISNNETAVEDFKVLSNANIDESKVI